MDRLKSVRQLFYRQYLQLRFYRFFGKFLGYLPITHFPIITHLICFRTSLSMLLMDLEQITSMMQDPAQMDGLRLPGTGVTNQTKKIIIRSLNQLALLVSTETSKDKNYNNENQFIQTTKNYCAQYHPKISHNC